MAGECAKKVLHALVHRCLSVLPEDVSAKTRVVKHLCRAVAGQVRGTFAGRVSENQFGFHFGGIVHSLPAFVYMNNPCTCVHGWVPVLGILFLIS